MMMVINDDGDIETGTVMMMTMLMMMILRNEQ